MGKMILVLEGSPRKGGNSDLLSDEFIRGATEAGHDVEKVYLQKRNIHYCVDCEVCQTESDGCVHIDDFGQVCRQLIACDVVVFASPVYYYSVTAQMKTFMDRTYSALTKISDKECYFIATGAGDQEKYYQTIIDTYHGFIGCFPNMEDKGIVLGMGVQKKGEIQGNAAMLKAYEMGKNV